MALYAGPVLNPAFHRASFFLDWDGTAYLYIAKNGYPPLYPRGGGYLAHTAFFPLLPWTTRWISYATRLPLETSAFLLVTVASLTACICVWWLAVETLGDRVGAGRSVLLMALWPASFVLSMNYSEGLFITFAALSLIWLQRRQWLLAGVAGLLAGLARAGGVVLVAAAAWCAFQALRRSKDVRALVAPLLAGLGMAIYFGFLWVRLGDPLLWFKAENKGWHASFDFGATSARYLILALQHPTEEIGLVASSAAALIGLCLLVWAFREHLPIEQIVFSAGILGLAIGSGFGGSIPRFVLDAFPLFFVPAKALGRRGAALLPPIAAASSAALVVLMLVVELTRTTVP